METCMQYDIIIKNNSDSGDRTVASLHYLPPLQQGLLILTAELSPDPQGSLPWF
jgi:hypothetical protein